MYMTNQADIDHFIDEQRLRPVGAYAQSDQSLC